MVRTILLFLLSLSMVPLPSVVSANLTPQEEAISSLRSSLGDDDFNRLLAFAEQKVRKVTNHLNEMASLFEQSRSYESELRELTMHSGYKQLVASPYKEAFNELVRFQNDEISIIEACGSLKCVAEGRRVLGDLFKLAEIFKAQQSSVYKTKSGILAEAFHDLNRTVEQGESKDRNREVVQNFVEIAQGKKSVKKALKELAPVLVSRKLHFRKSGTIATSELNLDRIIRAKVESLSPNASYFRPALSKPLHSSYTLNCNVQEELSLFIVGVLPGGAHLTCTDQDLNSYSMSGGLSIGPALMLAGSPMPIQFRIEGPYPFELKGGLWFGGGVGAALGFGGSHKELIGPHFSKLSFTVGPFGIGASVQLTALMIARN